jgi:E3 ubiquitin-protein ligase ZNF598
VKHRKVFISEQVLYSSASQLHKHEDKGDPSLKLKPHPMCKYCDVRFFSDEELFRHCEESHFKCWICERGNVLFNYFRDYKHLEEHFDNKHFLCSDKECLEKKFVVFRTQFELQAHEVSSHLGKRGLSKAESLAARTVQLNFNVRGSSQASTSTDLADASQYQQQQQAMYQSRIAGSNNGRMTRPAEVPVFFPDDRRRNTHSRVDDSQPPPPPENYNASDTGFNLSDRLAASASKPSAPAASASSSPSAPAAAQSSSLTPQERSKNLIAKIKAFLGSDAKFTEFRRLSAMFKQAQLAPQHYYAQFLKNFGESHESYALFEEMVDLLPDVKKQQALLEMHRKHQRLSSEFPALGILGGNAAPSPAASSLRSHWTGAPARQSAPSAPAPSAGNRGQSTKDDFPSLGGGPTESFPALGASSGASGSQAAPSWPAAPGNRNQGVTYSAGGKQKGKKVLLRYG